MSITERARGLLAQMTLEEKAGQLRQYFCFGPSARENERLAPEVEKMEAAIDSGLTGAMLFLSKAADTNAWQRRHLQASRLKIPLLFGFDVIHGLRTIFPVPIALAASWDLALARDCQAVAGREARAVGIHWAFAPMVDICRDPRWGRMVEGAGEDPFLGSAMAAAQVRGFQDGGVIAGPKHFAGYGAARGGRDYDEADLSDQELHNIYLPPFKAALDAGAGNIMTAYMPLNGVPATGNRWLLTDVLRTDWGFGGFVVSDANAVVNLITHGFTRDAGDAAARALEAGVDMEMTTGTAAYAALPEAVRAGLADEADIDRAVLRILEAKLKLGLFEQPLADEAEAERVLADPAHRAAARRAAARSAVLLRNEGGLLPLRDVRRIALLGPLAASARDHLGPWVFDFDLAETVTIADGLKGGAPPGVEVEWAPGVRMPERRIPSPFGQMFGVAATGKAAPFDDAAELQRALDLAAASDVTVLVLGERYSMSGEIASRSTLDLPGGQLALLQAAVATGKPCVVLVMSGRPLDLRWADEHVAAILQVWHPGTSGGGAVADLLFGRESPGGKLPFAWPRSAGQIPIPYSHSRSHDPGGQGRRYWEEESTPLYPFGFGLAYAAFAYANLSAARDGSTVVVEADVTNTGETTADEVVQLYVGQRHGAAARPMRELKGFERVTLAPGETRRVRFVLAPAHLRYWSAAARGWVLDAATFDVWIGGDSRAALHGEFT